MSMLNPASISPHLRGFAGFLFQLAADNTAAELRKSEITRKSWKHMADIMEVNPDNSTVRLSLRQVFHQNQPNPTTS